ncbi:hypothetical protein MHK_010536 [Candidatus Magnetomorum sp. HK-1]|nr:hypothetical protein MHK_010536 [Candidatus Magnetomorum sp. HK-1]
MFELPGVKLEMRNKSDKHQWLYFIKNAHKEEEDDIMVNYSIPEIHQAYFLLKQFSQDEETRLHAEARQLAIMTEKISIANAEKKGEERGLKMGEKQGQKSGKLLVAKNLMQKGMSIDIAIVTQLDIEDLNAF